MNGYEEMAGALEATGDYRVLRRLPVRSMISDSAGQGTHLALALDVETTGLDPLKDEVIEIAMLPFLISSAGAVFEIMPAFQALREPKGPIPPEITALTGIDDEMVRGKTIDINAMEDLLTTAVLVVAHHAAFDRPFAETLSPLFAEKHWGCSANEIDWLEEGLEGKKLTHLVQSMGFFHDAHRAVDDCRALVEILAHPLPRSRVTALSKLLAAARKPSWRIVADSTAFALKDMLKARSYRWNPDKKLWFTDVADEHREAEIAYLQREIYRSSRPITAERLTARNRYSLRGI